MNKTIGIILIVAALFFGFVGINKISESQETVNILGIIKVEAEDENEKETGYIMLAVSAICLVGGLMVMGKK